MKIEGTNQQNISYSSQNLESVQTEKQAQPASNGIKHSLEIVGDIKHNLGYRPTIQEKIIIESIETTNQKILGPQKEFEFAIHKETKQIMVKVIDKNTKEIIREIPPEKILDAVAQMCEIAGIFMDEKR